MRFSFQRSPGDTFNQPCPLIKEAKLVLVQISDAANLQLMTHDPIQDTMTSSSHKHCSVPLDVRRVAVISLHETQGC